MSVIRSVQSTSEMSATSMVVSGSGLSLFDKPLDRRNRDVVCTYLKDLPHKIVAVWIAARPINGVSNGFTFEHWCVKIQAPPSLISIDFLESDGFGKFGLQVTTAMEAELQDFLRYYVEDPNVGRQKKKWRLVASVTPSPLKNSNYKPDFLDPHELSTLKKYMQTRVKNKKKKNKNKNKNNNAINGTVNVNNVVNKPVLVKPKSVVLKKIKCSKKVCDIADFLEMWSEFDQAQQKKKKKKNLNQNNTNGNNGNDINGSNNDKPYNAVLYNCQQFAAQLFKYLVGTHYPDKVQEALKQTQSPADKRAFKKQNKIKNKPIDALSPKPPQTYQDFDQNDPNMNTNPINPSSKLLNNDNSDDDVKSNQ